jgi:hypothetical protein
MPLPRPVDRKQARAQGLRAHALPEPCRKRPEVLGQHRNARESPPRGKPIADRIGHFGFVEEGDDRAKRRTRVRRFAHRSRQRGGIDPPRPDGLGQRRPRPSPVFPPIRPVLRRRSEASNSPDSIIAFFASIAGIASAGTISGT